MPPRPLATGRARPSRGAAWLLKTRPPSSTTSTTSRAPASSTPHPSTGWRGCLAGGGGGYGYARAYGFESPTSVITCRCRCCLKAWEPPERWRGREKSQTHPPPPSPPRRPRCGRMRPLLHQHRVLLPPAAPANRLVEAGEEPGGHCWTQLACNGAHRRTQPSAASVWPTTLLAALKAMPVPCAPSG